MQIFSLRIKAYRSWAMDDTTPKEAFERLRKLDLYRTLRNEGCSERTALDAINWSRARYYRWARRFKERGLKGLVAQSRRPKRLRPSQWTRQQEQRVLHLRRSFPAWGKTTLWKVLSRDQGFKLSISSVGRILAKGIRLGRIRPCAFFYGRVKAKRHRRFGTAHAKRWKYSMKAKHPGEMIQIDHMSVGLGASVEIKEFKAVCPVSKQMVMRAYHRATAGNAKRFLMDLKKDLPFQIQSIQVDGGSEFMAEFEQACEDLKIPLFVLPPKRPQYNGCVERANGTSRAEFYPFYAGALHVDAVNVALQEYQHLYNDYRPHQSLDLMTPNEYLKHIGQAA